MGVGKQCHNFSSVLFLKQNFSPFSQAAEQGTEAFITMHLNPTCPGTETKIPPDHHLSAWAEPKGFHGQYISRESMIHIPPQDQSPGRAQQQEWIPGNSQVSSWSAVSVIQNSVGPEGGAVKSRER